jgi:putative membrane protein
LFLSPAETDAIASRIAQVEAHTGTQLVTAIVGRSDAYPELAWKAFALGAAMAALAVVALDVVRPNWMSAYAVWSNVTPILGVGGANAILALVLPPYARLYLNRVRCHGEVKQCAQAMFLERQLFKTHARNGVLLFASVFERRVELLADVGFHGRVDEHEWRTVIDAMTPLLAAARPAEALTRGLECVEALLSAKGFVATGRHNELPDRPIDEGTV